MGKFIVLEGISGSGKTEIGKELSRQLSAIYYTTPPSIFRDARESIGSNVCLESRFLFYLSSVAQASWEINKILQTETVVCDKYIWSTICYHTVFGLEIEIPSLISCCSPDHTFLVTCAEEKRLARLRNRGDMYDLARQETERKCLIEFRKHITQEIDNTSDGLDCAVGQIRSIIGA